MNKLKKEYIKLADGTKEAPFYIVVTYPGHKYGTGLDEKIESLASRNKGESTGSGFRFGGRDLCFEFYSRRGLKTFIKKAKIRYNVNFTIYERTITESEIDLQSL